MTPFRDTYFGRMEPNFKCTLLSYNNPETALYDMKEGGKE